MLAYIPYMDPMGMESHNPFMGNYGKFTINIPEMLAYIPYMNPMGMESHNPFMGMENLPSIYPKC